MVHGIGVTVLRVGHPIDDPGVLVPRLDGKGDSLESLGGEAEGGVAMGHQVRVAVQPTLPRLHAVLGEQLGGLRYMDRPFRGGRKGCQWAGKGFALQPDQAGHGCGGLGPGHQSLGIKGARAVYPAQDSLLIADPDGVLHMCVMAVDAVPVGNDGGVVQFLDRHLLIPHDIVENNGHLAPVERLGGKIRVLLPVVFQVIGLQIGIEEHAVLQSGGQIWLPPGASRAGGRAVIAADQHGEELGIGNGLLRGEFAASHAGHNPGFGHLRDIG